MNKSHIVYIICITLSVLSCKSSDDNDGSTLSCNKWIVSIMRNDYLWNKEIPTDANLDYSTPSNTFFYTLLSKKDGKDSGSSHRYYSFIESNDNYKSTKSISDDTNSYGLEIHRYSVTGQTYEYDRVLYVLPNSAAAQAGLVRGDWITKINGNYIYHNTSPADYTKLLKGSSVQLTVYHSLTDNTYKTVTLQPSGAVNNDPIYYSSTINIDSKKIGYLMYNCFQTGPHDNFNDNTYNKELIDLFNNKFSDVNEFILDMRYNPGGYIVCAQLLSRLLVPDASISSIFSQLTYNDNTSKKYTFKSIENNFNLHGFKAFNLSTLYIIVSAATASAAEMVINGLSPYINIVLIGAKTEGKNVGSVHYDSGSRYAWNIQPITFSITSALNNDYSNGLSPTYVMNELNVNENPTLLNIGDENEYLLHKALSLIGGEKAAYSKIITKTNKTMNVEVKPFASSITDHRTKGLILISE